MAPRISIEKQLNLELGKQKTVLVAKMVFGVVRWLQAPQE